MADRTPQRRRFDRDDRGAAMVEFAVALPLLFTFAFGIIDFGRAFYVYNALNSIARDGARYGSALKNPTVDGVKIRMTTVIARQYLPTSAPALTAANIDVRPGTLAAHDSLVVSIHGYSFDSWLPVIPLAQNLQLGAHAAFRREW